MCLLVNTDTHASNILVKDEAEPDTKLVDAEKSMLGKSLPHRSPMTPLITLLPTTGQHRGAATLS